MRCACLLVHLGVIECVCVLGANPAISQSPFIIKAHKQTTKREKKRRGEGKRVRAREGEGKRVGVEGRRETEASKRDSGRRHEDTAKM